MSHLVLNIPEKCAVLFQPSRYKVLHGGRGSGKSWAVAQALLAIGVSRRVRVLCAREVQKSIRDSVHRLLSDQVQSMGLAGHYEVLESIISGKNGTEFLFAGLAQHTVASVKSFEGCDLCWIEEAQTVSKKSWDILIPTIRGEDSEIWVTMNPILDTDETYRRFVLSPPPGATVVQMNWRDNPWFPPVLEQEREHCLATSPSDYDNIWEGQCRAAVEGAVYAGEVAAAMSHGRICNIPYDPALKVHAVWDLGWNDSTAIILVQRVRSEVRVIEYIEDDHKTLDHYAALLNSKPYNWGYDFLPHDGRTKDFKTGKSAEEILRRFGRKVKITPNIGVESGIRSLRLAFPQIYFDRVKAAGLIECLKRYRRVINQQTGEAGAPLHDAASHGADAARYLAVNIERLVNDDESNHAPRLSGFQPYSADMGY